MRKNDIFAAINNTNMGSWTIYNKSGVAKAVVKELELHDEWMAECYLTITAKSAQPISFAVGDYIDYRNERYTIEYDPNEMKKSTSGTFGEGFVYENIKFVGAQDEVVRCDFNDIVLSDNNVHYTALPTFPFYCESVDDLLDRIQANLEDLYPNGWIVIGLNTVRNYQRGTIVGRAAAFEAAYRQWVDPDLTPRTDPYGKQSVAETADNITCWDAMKKVHDDFDLNFIVRGRVIIVGTAGVFTSNTFRYGKGNGLYEIERVADSDQQIVTRLRAYGSEQNLPQHYYANLNTQVFAHISNVQKFSTQGCSFLLDLDFDSKYFSYRSEDYPGDAVYPNYIIELKANDITVRGYITRDYQSNSCYVYCEYTGGDDDDRDEPDAAKMAAFVAAISNGDRVDFVDYVNKDTFDSTHKDSATENLPDNMAVSRLMLPGFPNQSLNSWVQAHKNLTGFEWLAQAVADGFTFSTDKYRPYIDSPNISQYGVRPASIYFDGNNETDDIHPTIEGMEHDNAPVDEVYAADQVEDNGVYPAGDEVKNINITLPDLGFELDKVYEEGASIDMKNGMCGARSFKISKKPTKDTNNRWVCNVERVHDESLDLWFPYSDFQIHGSSEQGREHGDKYVLTGITMPDAYIDFAAVKLLRASIEALKKNHATRYTYQPRIDEIFMQRQHDTAISSQGVVSLHDTLKAGDIFAFADNDLGIDANVIIDVLTIKENGNNGLPTYEVTLRNEKQVETIQKITNKIDSIISGDAIFGGGGSMAMQQYQSLIDKNIQGKYLSRQKDDNAEGVITFNKGVKIGQYHSRFLGSGAAVDPAGNAEFESIYSRSFISTPEFRFNRISVTEGEQWCTNGYGTIESVVEGEDENGDAVVNGGLITLHLEENDYASIAEGDICRGIYNDIADQYHTADMDDDTESAAGSSAQEGDGMGFSSKGGFFTSYFYIERIVKNLRGECQFIYKLRSSTTPHPCAFMKFAQYGSFTNADRRASSYATSIGHYYEMVLEGVKTWQIESPNVVYRKGYLGDMVVELADGTERTLQGYGLYAQNNVYFGSAVIQLDPKTLEMLEDEIAAYDVNISGHVSAIQVDNHGYIIGGIYTDTSDGGITTREYRVHSAITVRKNGVLLTEALPSAEAGKGTYKITCSAVDCSYVLDDSTIYLTHIDNLLNLPTDDPSDYDPEVGGLMERCRIDIVVDCEGKTSIQKSIVIAINHDGMDGKGVEYIFITKETWDGTDADKPTIYDVAEDRQVDDYCPYTDAQHTDQWTDEPTGVSDNQRFEFYAQRKQINGIWQPFGEVKQWNRYVVDGVTPYMIDLSNEQSFVVVDSNGNETYETSRLMLFLGQSYAFNDFAISITPVNITCNNNSAAFTLTAEQKAAAQAAGYYTLTPSAITADSATITVTATKGNIVLSAVYKINKSNFAYSLITSLDTIRKNKNGSIVSTDVTLTLQVKKIVGVSTSILTTYSELTAEGLSLNYVNASGSAALTDVSIATSTLIGSGAWGKIELIKNSVIVDSERINVVFDGIDGDDGDDGYGIVLTITRDNYTEENWSANAVVGGNESFSYSGGITVRAGDYFIVKGTSTDKGLMHTATFKCTSQTSSLISGDCISHICDGKKGDPGDDGNYYVKQYALGDTRTSAPSSGWQSETVMPTSDYPYVWERSCLYNPNTQSYVGSWVYTCLTGYTGETGNTGPMYYPAGIYASNKTYTVTEKLVPVVEYSGSYYYAKQTVPADRGYYPTNTDYWGAFSNFAAAFVEILFASFAKLGSFVISDDWFISQYGTVNGYNSANYQAFNGVFTDQTTNFIPYLAMDAKNGSLFCQKGTIGGFEIGATSLGRSSLATGATGYTYITPDGKIKLWKSTSASDKTVIDAYGAVTMSASGANETINISASSGAKIKLYVDNGSKLVIDTPNNLRRTPSEVGEVYIDSNGYLKVKLS